MTDDLVEKVALGIDDFLSRTGVPLEMAEAMHCARAALSAIEDAGWCVVPVDPDNAMETLGAATFQVSRTPDSVGRRPSGEVAARAIYRAMLAARPRITGETQ